MSNKTFKLPIDEKYILAVQMVSNMRKSFWIWDKDESLFESDTLVRIDTNQDRIIYVHFCSVESIDIIIESIKQMHFVNNQLLYELMMR